MKRRTLQGKHPDPKKKAFRGRLYRIASLFDDSIVHESVEHNVVVEGSPAAPPEVEASVQAGQGDLDDPEGSLVSESDHEPPFCEPEDWPEWP